LIFPVFLELEVWLKIKNREERSRSKPSGGWLAGDARAAAILCGFSFECLVVSHLSGFRMNHPAIRAMS